MNIEQKLELKPVRIEAVSIPDAWFQCVDAIFDHGFKYKIEHGSYIGETRLEFDQIVIVITFPYDDPYDKMLPVMPENFPGPPPVAQGYIEQYLPYLMTDHKEPGELYTYGSRIFHQIPYFIRVLKETPNTNQAILQVAAPTDNALKDPPCLRHIDMRIKDGYLIFYPYFRSWDLWGGFPANLGALAVLQKDMADEIGVKSGPIIASSKGLHLYRYVHELAKMRTGKTK